MVGNQYVSAYQHDNQYFGIIDDEGYLKICSRIKDVIKSGGEWISSVDLENKLIGYLVVLEAYYIIQRWERWEEGLLALVILKPEYKGNVLKQELKEFFNELFLLNGKFLMIYYLWMKCLKTGVAEADKKREVYKNYYVENTDK